jgi:uncharacterized membrane protein YphA (DoxX/SURF4 family)
MNSIKRDRIIYWVLTLLVLLPTAGSGLPELFTNGPAMTVQSFHTLGYPLYLLKILGLAKILGALAILTGRFPKLKEWAYAGFTFDFLGAIASHILAGDLQHAPFPFLFFLLLMGSYFFWNKTTGAHSATRPNAS